MSAASLGDIAPTTCCEQSKADARLTDVSICQQALNRSVAATKEGSSHDHQRRDKVNI
jgi:hypothetical protein